MKTKYITDSQGHKTDVIVPIEKYEKMLEDLEEFEDIKAYDKAMNQKQQFKTANEVFSSIEKKRNRT